MAAAGWTFLAVFALLYSLRKISKFLCTGIHPKKNSALFRRTQPAEKAEFPCKIFSSQAKAYRAMGVFSMRVMSHMARMPSTSRGRPATRPAGLGPYRKFAPSEGSQ